MNTLKLLWLRLVFFILKDTRDEHHQEPTWSVRNPLLSISLFCHSDGQLAGILVQPKNYQRSWHKVIRPKNSRLNLGFQGRMPLKACFYRASRSIPANIAVYDYRQVGYFDAQDYAAAKRLVKTAFPNRVIHFENVTKHW